MSDILRESGAMQREAKERAGGRQRTDGRARPAAGGSPSGPRFGIEDDDGTITWLCHKCGPRELIRRLDEHAGAA